jgi:hypothetical protein
VIEKVAYGVGLIGLIASGVICMSLPQMRDDADSPQTPMLAPSTSLFGSSGTAFTCKQSPRSTTSPGCRLIDFLFTNAPDRTRSCTFGLCAISFILASAIPIFNFVSLHRPTRTLRYTVNPYRPTLATPQRANNSQLIALTGSICFAPLALMLPAVCFFYDNHNYIRGTIAQKAKWVLNAFLFALGVFFCVAGTYATVRSIINAYAAGTIGTAFSCADNAA